MAIEKVRAYFAQFGMESRVLEFPACGSSNSAIELTMEKF